MYNKLIYAIYVLSVIVTWSSHFILSFYVPFFVTEYIIKIKGSLSGWLFNLLFLLYAISGLKPTLKIAWLLGSMHDRFINTNKETAM
jgi:hypothetical protein